MRKTLLTYVFNEIVLTTVFTTIYTRPPSKYYAIIKEKIFHPTSTSIFDKPRPFIVEFNNVSNFKANFVGLHGVLLANYRPSKKNYKKLLQEFSDEEVVVVKILLNEKW